MYFKFNHDFIDTVRDNIESIKEGATKGFPLVFSAGFFGLIFGFTGATGELSIFVVSSMSYIIFAGSAQFIAIVLINQQAETFAIIITAIILNLRHLLYGGVLNDILEFEGIKKLIPAYFLTDEAFLVTTLVNKEMKLEQKEFKLDYVLLGAGFTLWIVWNIATIIGFLIHDLISDLIVLPDNFVIAASFIGFLTEHWVKYPTDRIVIISSAIIAFSLGSIASSSILLITIMISGALVGMIQMAKGGQNNV